jgi:hypothetical protein
VPDRIVVGPQGVVGAAEQAECDSEGVATADDRAVEADVTVDDVELLFYI